MKLPKSIEIPLNPFMGHNCYARTTPWPHAKCRLSIRNVGLTTDISGNSGCPLEMVEDKQPF